MEHRVNTAAMKRSDFHCLLVYITLAVATGFADLRMRAHYDHVVASYIPGVLANTDGPPGVYRVLAPFLVDLLADLTGASIHAVWYTTRLLWILLAYLIVHFYLRTWLRPRSRSAE